MVIQKINKEVAWKIRHEVMWPTEDLDYVKLKDDDLGIHYGVIVEAELVSVISLFINKDKA